MHDHLMVGLIGEPERPERLAKNFGKALFECLLEALELIPLACVVFLGVAPLSCGTHGLSVDV